MRKLRKKVYGCAAAHTIYLGPGRKEFHPKKPRPGIEHYVFEAGRESIAQVANPSALDQGVIGNFMAARFARLAPDILHVNQQVAEMPLSCDPPMMPAAS